MVNLSNLNNLSSFSFNESIFNNSQNVSSEIINIANTESSGYYGLIVMTGLFIWFLYEFMREEGMFRLDFIKAGTFASGITLVIGIMMLISELTTSYQHLIWYLLIFCIFVVSSYFMKQKGL